MRARIAMYRGLLTVEQAADFLAISPRTVGELARAAEIPAVKVGNQWRFRVGSLDEWARANEVNRKDAQ